MVVFITAASPKLPSPHRTCFSLIHTLPRLFLGFSWPIVLFSLIVSDQERVKTLPSWLNPIGRQPTFTAPLQSCPSGKEPRSANNKFTPGKEFASVAGSDLLPCWARGCLVCLLVLHWVPCGLGRLIRVEPPPPGQTRIASVSLTDGAVLHSLQTSSFFTAPGRFVSCLQVLLSSRLSELHRNNDNLSFILYKDPGRPNLALCPTRRHVNQTTSSSPATARELVDS